MCPIDLKARNQSALESPFSPIVENRPPREVRWPLRVVSFNAQGGIRFDGIAACFQSAGLRDAALVLLCEVDWQTRRSGGRKVAAELAGLLGMSYAYMPQFALLGGNGDTHGYLGIAILSAAPIDDAAVVAIPDPYGHRSLRRGRRFGAPCGLRASAGFSGTRLELGLAHLHSRCDPAGRALQIEAYLASFPRTGPAIFGGDLNTTTLELGSPRGMAHLVRHLVLNPRRFRQPELHEPLFERLRESGLVIDGANEAGRSTFTFARAIPPFMRPKLDWIAVRDLKPVAGSARVIPARRSFFSTRISDHDFIAVDLTR
jgi:endonuclease/exonuclease/phosphatase family metal-dependent hydrolase